MSISSCRGNGSTPTAGIRLASTKRDTAQLSTSNSAQAGFLAGLAVLSVLDLLPGSSARIRCSMPCFLLQKADEHFLVSIGDSLPSELLAPASLPRLAVGPAIVRALGKAFDVLAERSRVGPRIAQRVARRRANLTGAGPASNLLGVAYGYRQERKAGCGRLVENQRRILDVRCEHEEIAVQVGLHQLWPGQVDEYGALCRGRAVDSRD